MHTYVCMSRSSHKFDGECQGVAGNPRSVCVCVIFVAVGFQPSVAKYKVAKIKFWTVYTYICIYTSVVPGGLNIQISSSSGMATHSFVLRRGLSLDLSWLVQQIAYECRLPKVGYLVVTLFLVRCSDLYLCHH